MAVSEDNEQPDRGQEFPAPASKACPKHCHAASQGHAAARATVPLLVSFSFLLKEKKRVPVLRPLFLGIGFVTFLQSPGPTNKAAQIAEQRRVLVQRRAARAKKVSLGAAPRPRSRARACVCVRAPPLRCWRLRVRVTSSTMIEPRRSSRGFSPQPPASQPSILQKGVCGGMKTVIGVRAKKLTAP